MFILRLQAPCENVKDGQDGKINQIISDAWITNQTALGLALALVQQIPMLINLHLDDDDIP